MATDFSFRRRAVKALTNKIGVYVLSDLDNVPIYVGQSTDKKYGIRGRVAGHLTSARSDIIANRQIDVWEIAYVWTYPEEKAEEIPRLESVLFHHFHRASKLMNGTVPPPVEFGSPPQPEQAIQVMSAEEIADKKDPTQRLPRQAAHYAQLVGHFVAVKNSPQIALAMHAHFERLRKYHAQLLKSATDQPEEEDE